MLRSLSAQVVGGRGEALNKSSLSESAGIQKKKGQPESLGMHFTFKCNYFMLQFISAGTLESTPIKQCHKSCIVWIKHVLAHVLALEEI